MFSDNPNKKTTSCLQTGEGCTVDDVIRVHDETQEDWEKRIKEIRAKIERELQENKEMTEDTREHIEEIYSMLAVGKEDMAGIRKHLRGVKKELQARQEQQDEQIKRRDEMLNQMDKKLDTTLLRLDYKRQGDKKRNGQLDKIGIEEEDHEKRITRLETQMDNLKDISNSTLSLLKAIGVGLVIFFVTFFIKTFIWGF